MTTAPASSIAPTTPFTTEPIAPSQRLQVLDILRGCAILGMFIVHFMYFNPNSDGGGEIGAAINQAILWLIAGKAATMFAILFGVGFAIQLRRADARGEDGRWRFVRRLLGVAFFGVLVSVLAGPFDIFFYAWSGVWLLLLRRWSVRGLLIALFVSAILIGVWNVAVGGYQWATMGAERANEVYQSAPQFSPARQAALEAYPAAAEGTSFFRLAQANLALTLYWVTDLWGDWQHGFTPGLVLGSLIVGYLTFLLIGFLSVRLGVFDRPTDHRRLLVVALLIGLAWWAVGQWGLYLTIWPATWETPSVRVSVAVRSWLGLFRFPYLGLAVSYIAAITLLVSHSKKWERRLSALFGAAGRMALTNYILQFVVIGMIFGNYAFGAKELTPQMGLAIAFLLFGALVVLSRWWLAQFRYGPAEWLLRSLTYARLQPFAAPRRSESADVERPSTGSPSPLSL